MAPTVAAGAARFCGSCSDAGTPHGVAIAGACRWVGGRAGGVGRGAVVQAMARIRTGNLAARSLGARLRPAIAIIASGTRPACSTHAAPTAGVALHPPRRVAAMRAARVASTHQVSKPRAYFGVTAGRAKRSQYATLKDWMCQFGIT